MARLPQEIDYGQRPSLRTGRVDRPTSANADLADSVLRAATTFQGVLAERKNKEDRLNYALARNELQQLDLEQRANLAEDSDWQSHDQRYSEGFTAGREAIGQRYNLSPHDTAILDSESNLIQAQGRVQVGSNSRKLEIDEALGRYAAGREKVKEAIVLADPGSRNNMLLGQLEVIDAQVEKGYMSEEEGAAEREALTQDIAMASLLAMPAEERHQVIRDSLKHRKEGAGPLTAEDIRAGNGTGSIADFLHADTAAKMLEAAGREDKTNKQRAESQNVVNSAWDLFPEVEDQGKRMKYIRDNSSGTVQNLAEEDARQRNNDEVGANQQASQQSYEDYSRQMESEGLRFNEIPADELGELTAYHYDELKKRSEKLSYDEQWPSVSQRERPRPPLTGMSHQGWNELPNFGPGGKTEQNLETAEFYNAFTERDFNEIQREQINLRAIESSKITTGDLEPSRMVNNALNAMEFSVIDDPKNDKLNGIRARLEGDLRRRIIAEQNSTTPPHEIDEQAKNKILAEILTPYAFTDTDFFWFDSDFDTDETVPIALMTAKQREDAFIDLGKANLQTMTYQGIEMNVEQILRKMGNDARPAVGKPSDHNLRRAAFAFMNNIGVDSADTEAEVLRRLRGE